jgi:aminopeptidase N
MIFRTLVAFELRHQVASPLFLVSFAIFFLLSFGATTLDEIQIGSLGNVWKNSPFAIAQTVAVLNLFAMFVTTAFAANAVVRDDETGFSPILRSTRIRKTSYLAGRFVGAGIVSALVCLAVPMGILVGSLMPWQDPEKIGPLVPGHYVHAVLVFGLPTQVVLAAFFFAVATATRSMMWTYVGVVAFLVGYTASRFLLREDQHEVLSALLDPFGLGAMGRATQYWTASDRNRFVVPFEGLLLWNRVLWLGLAAIASGVALKVFRMEERPAKGASPRNPAPEEATDATTKARPSTTQARLVPATAGRPGGAWAQCLALARMETSLVLRSPAFLVLVALGVFNSFGGLSGVAEFRGVASLPVTREVVSALLGSFTLFPIIIAIYYGGELVWRDRQSRMHEIVDATAAPNWAFLLPKVLAVAWVLLGTLMAAALTGIVFQAAHGYFQFEIGGYALWFLLPSWIVATQLAVLSVAVQSIVPSKPFGWAVMLAYLVAETSLRTLGFQHALYNFGDAAAVPLSDMNGMGHFWVGRAWHQAYWTVFCVLLLAGVHVVRVRGAESRWRPRLLGAPRRLRGPAGAVMAAAALAWAGLGAWIFFNTNLRNPYIPSTEQERITAEAEKALLPFEKVPQPTIRHVDLAVELWPAKARARTVGRYRLENRHETPVDTLHVETPSTLQVHRMEIAGGSLKQAMTNFGHRILTLSPPMQPGEQRDLAFETVQEEPGFVNASPATRVVGNGTFLDNASIAPTLGVSRGSFLQDRARRRKHGLPADLRPPALEDRTANRHHYLRHDSDWVTADITVTTDEDQVPIAPGRMEREDVRDGRRTRVFKADAPIQNFFSIQSARYAVRSEIWSPPSGKPIQLAIFHHPPHARNVDRMLAAMKASLALFAERFSPYQFEQFRILEFPAYASFAQSFANTVPYSEAIGFIQAFDDKDSAEKIDMVTYVTAHEIAHQWWAHQVIGADKQGATLLSESFSQYSALLVMEKLYGREQIWKFLKHELDSYLRARGSEAREEVPLARVEDQPYIHYQKGALAMWWLKEAAGEVAVNRTLQRLIREFALKPAPYPDALDFLRILREECGPQHAELITDLFERITLYDLSVRSAKATRRPDGRFDVVMTVEARKLQSDGQGAEKEAPLDEPFEIGLFAEKPGAKGFGKASILALERRRLRSGSQQLEWVADKPPRFVGVDPFHYRIDRKSDDNLREVDAPAK